MAPMFVKYKHWLSERIVLLSLACVPLLANSQTHSFPDFELPEHACSRDSIHFTNTSIVATGDTVRYVWEFEGAEEEVTDQPLAYWAEGNQQKVFSIYLHMIFQNEDTLTKTKYLQVNHRPIAKFSIADACEGEQATIINQSQSYFGDSLTFTWDIPDLEADSNGSMYWDILGITRLINASLKIKSQNRCTDSMVKAITIHAAPDASFQAELIGKTLTVKANDHSHQIYAWRFEGGGRANTPEATWVYDNFPNNPFTVCLSAKSELCWSEECETVYITNVDDLNHYLDILIYPNPSSSAFSIKGIEETGNLKLMNVQGAIVWSAERIQIDDQRIFDLNNLAPAVYTLSIQLEDGRMFRKRIAVK